MQRAAAAGARAVVLTVDTPYVGRSTGSAACGSTSPTTSTWSTSPATWSPGRSGGSRPSRTHR